MPITFNKFHESFCICYANAVCHLEGCLVDRSFTKPRSSLAFRIPDRCWPVVQLKITLCKDCFKNAKIWIFSFEMGHVLFLKIRSACHLDLRNLKILEFLPPVINIALLYKFCLFKFFDIKFAISQPVHISCNAWLVFINTSFCDRSSIQVSAEDKIKLIWPFENYCIWVIWLHSRETDVCDWTYLWLFLVRMSTVCVLDWSIIWAWYQNTWASTSFRIWL